MGTISEKLTYLNNTKQQIKENLNKFGSNITENDTFRSYSNVINDIYDKLPKVSANGSNFSLENAQNGKLDSFGMDGNTEQTTYSGKNLYKWSNVTYSSDVTTVTWCFQDGTGGAYGGNITDKTIYKFELEAGTYKMSGTSIDDNILTIQAVKNGSPDEIILTSNNLNPSTSTATITLTEKTTLCVRYRVTDPSLGIGNTKIQIEQGSTATDYEPYVGGTASPNPDYPQDIRVVENEQVVNVTGKNLFDKDSQNFKQYYILNDNGEETQSNASQYSLNFTKVKPNTTYTIQGKLCSSLNVTRIYEYDENKNWIKRSGGIGISSLPYTFTTNNNTYYLRFQTEIAVYDGNTVQLEEGSTATTYEPYQSQDYEIDLGDIELCKIDTYKDSIKKSTGKNLFDKETMILQGLNVNVSTNQIASVSSSTSIYIPCKPNVTYTISKELTSRFRYGTTSSFPEVGTNIENLVQNDSGLTSTFTTNSNAKYFVAWIYTTTYDTTPLQQILNSIQIEENSTATSYEPYGTDWYIKKEIGKVVLDGSEDWFTQRNTSPYVFALNYDNYKRTQENICKCNFFSSVVNGGYGDLTDGQIRFRYNSGDTNKNLYLCTTVASTINDFQTWLSTHNTEVYYVLATPIYETITDETLISQLESIETITGLNKFSVSNENNVLPTLYVSRLKELDSLT